MSARRSVRPEKDTTSCDRVGIERTEVSAVEAFWVIGDNEDLSCLEGPTSVPGRHCAPSTISGLCECNRAATYENVGSPKRQKTIARNGGNRLQEIDGPREIASASSEGRNGWGQSQHDQITDLRGPRPTPYNPTGMLGDAFQMNAADVVGRLKGATMRARAIAKPNRGCALTAFAQRRTVGGPDPTTA